MRRLLTTLLTLILCATQATAATPVAAGAKCSKAGTTSIKSGMKYTCVKKGKSLVWSKPTKIAVTPVTPVTPVVPVKPLTLEEQWDATGSNALKVYRKWARVSDGVTPSVTIDFKLSAGLWPSVAAEFKRRANNVIAFFDPYFKPTLPIFFIGGRFEDVEWACKTLEKWPNQTVDSCIADSMEQQRNIHHDSWGGGVPSGSQHWYLLQTEQSIDSRSFWPRVEHEYIHIIQQNQIGRDFGQKVTCWYHGMAEYLGILTATQGNLRYFLDTRNRTITGAPVKRPRDMTAQDYADWLTKASKRVIPNSGIDCRVENQEGDYHDAILAAEWMIDRLGLPGWLDFEASLRTLEWDAAMSKAFNKPVPAIYLEMGEYMLKETQLVKEHDFPLIPVCNGRIPGPNPTPIGCRY